MSIDTIAFILENAYHCKIKHIPHAMVISYQLHEGYDYEEIELEIGDWFRLEKRYMRFIDKWGVEESDND